jgi:uncharacterized phiE125 gp8 family phage protein
MIDIAEIREYLRVDEGVDTATLTTLLNAAIVETEDHCGRVWLTRTITETHRPYRTLLLRRRPVTEVVSVLRDGIEMDPDEYAEELDVARLYRNMDWHGEISVTYVAGYGVTASAVFAAVPQVKAALLDTIAHWYNNRTNVQSVGVQGAGTVTYASSMPLPASAMAKLRALVVPRV